jgi:class 3 adenylate cyclase/DNA-binding winged helix-turn-helix (wHTH) protein/predicted ATPase
MIYRFADCALHTQLYILQRAGQETRLSRKVFEVLCYLIEHRDRVVSKQELCDQVWEGYAISDATLESCLRAVRLTVGDSGQAQRIIQTQRGYGYRFVADVEPLPEDVPPTPLPPAAVPHPLTPPLAVPDVRPCAACHYTNPEEAIFCAACGTRLRQLCAHCGQVLLLPAAFCTACGQPCIVLSLPEPVASLAAAPALSQTVVTPPDQRSVDAERKLVTVLCCTVARTVSGGGRFDLDTLYNAMQELHDLAHDVVHTYGGRLHAAIGDRLLILFGMPTAHEDDTRRAVRVALELRRNWQVRQEFLGTVSSASMGLRIGLHTGLMVVGGRQDEAEFTPVVGDVVSVAMALQEQAAPGQILCSDATARLVQRTVRLAAGEPVALPGQSTPVTTYAVLRHRGRRAPRWERWGRVLSPFVGREREITTLHALLAQVEQGRGQVVGIVGEPGIGKSRLLYEFRQSLEGKRLTYLTGRCLSYGSTTPYLPVLDVLRHNCGITETDRPEDITAKVHRALQEVDMAPEEWASVLLHLLGVQEEPDTFAALSPEARRARTLTAGLQMCVQGSRRQPLILEIEDLHWIDASSDECLMALVERMAGAAILVLVTYRPGYRPPWVDKSYATQVSLQPLTPQDSLQVVQAVLPSAVQAAPLVPQLLTKAEGNPFFLEELARTVVEQGADAPSSTVPDTVQAVLTARMDRLPATAKRLLQAAAVIGKDVVLPLLRAVTEVSEEAMHRDLGHLRVAEFLYETYALSAPIYTFKHALTQEVAYQSLVRQARQQRHARIAQVLEAQFPEVVETQPERLAQHYTEASFPEQALPYWQRAGQRAIERSANVEAVSHFTKGLELLKILPVTPERTRQALALQLALGPPLQMIKGETALEVEAVYTQAYELAQQVGDRQQLLSALMNLSRLYLNRARIQKARELAEQCFTLVQSMQDPRLLQTVHQRLGSTLFFHGEIVLARTHFEQGIALYTAQQDRLCAFRERMHSGVSCLSYLAWTLWLLGYPDQAWHRSCDALALARESSYAYSLTVALHYAAVLRLARREARLAQELAEETIEFSRLQGFAQWEVGGIFMRGGALIEQGLVEEGLDHLWQAHATSRAMGKELAQTHIFVRLAEACLQGKRVEEGLQVLTEALHFIHESGERYLEAEVYRLKGNLLLQQDIKSDRVCAPSQPALILTEAENSFRHALAVARLQQAKSLELRAAMSLSRLWQQQGKHIEAYQLLAEVYAWFTEGFETQDLQEAQTLLKALV